MNQKSKEAKIDEVLEKLNNHDTCLARIEERVNSNTQQLDKIPTLTRDLLNLEKEVDGKIEWKDLGKALIISASAVSIVAFVLNWVLA